MGRSRKTKPDRVDDRPLVTSLKDLFDKPLDELLPELHDRIQRSYGPLRWDDLSREQRRLVASQLDWQHPQGLVEQEIAEEAFRKGARRILVPRKQRFAAQRPRPSRQKVIHEQIEWAYEELKRRGLQLRAVDAYRLLFPASAPLSLRAFQKRWRLLLTKIKKRT
jgi:hypothetical protein